MSCKANMTRETGARGNQLFQFPFWVKRKSVTFTLSFQGSGELMSQSWTSLKCFTVYLSRAQKNNIKVLSPSLLCLTLLLLKRIFRAKIPLETAGFSHTLFNLPQTFVKELKGINWRNFSIVRCVGKMCCKRKIKVTGIIVSAHRDPGDSLLPNQFVTLW